MAALSCVDALSPVGQTTLCSYPELSNTLPDGYEYHLCSFNSLEGGFDATIRVALQDEKGATKWLADYQEQSCVTLRVKATKPESGRVNLFKVYYRCHHNTLPRSQKANMRLTSKNTRCPAQVTIAVKKNPRKHSAVKVKDPHLPVFATVVNILHTHNHQIVCADAFKFRDVSKDVIAKFTELYAKGHSPSSALNTHKVDLQLEHGNDYLYISADRAQCPDLQFCHRLYRKIFGNAYGAASAEKTIQDLEVSIKSYNEEQGLECCKMDQVNGKLVIAVCTPLMRRIHTTHQCSGELVFVDASSGMDRSGGTDRYNCRLFMILTHSVAGGLPLGCLITTSESTEVIVAALKLYMQMVPDDGFYGRGAQLGPAVFLTDDRDGECQCLQEVFPNSPTVLCVLHLLQATWRFLWEGKNSIDKEDRPHLLGLVKGMVYADTVERLEEKYDEMNRDAIAKRYTCFIRFTKHLYDRRQLWALCLRCDLPLLGNNTTNYVEAAMRILKDQLFHRVRAYNPVQLLDFLLTTMVGYYEKRLSDLANGRIDVTMSKRYLPDSGRMTVEMVKPLKFPLFEVRSESDPEKKYEVDMSLAMCTCNAGLNGAPCKHQYAIVKYCKVQSFNFLPVNDKFMRRRLLLATEQERVPEGWFAPLPVGHTRTAMPGITETQEVAQVPASVNMMGFSSTQNETRVTCTTSRSDPGNSTQEFRIDDLEAGLQFMASNLANQMRENPEELVPAVHTFLAQVKNLKTNSETVSALMSFGKSSAAGQHSKKRSPDWSATRHHCPKKRSSLEEMSYW